ncbi:MAG: T9SS type A sorting domain-containing protein [Candidatus Limimorpha sp.]
MMNKKFFLLSLLAFAIVSFGNAQEYITGFNHGGKNLDKKTHSFDQTPLSLPFFDDFSNAEIYPDERNWQTNNVFVNSGFPLMPVNHGSATLDIVDRFGVVYANGSSNPFLADSLMSWPIRLDSLDGNALSPDDSLYFSFYYQPGGFGDSPDRDDSLVLKFGYGFDDFIIDTVSLDTLGTFRNISWNQVWASEGVDIDTFLSQCNTNQYFKKVMIPIVDTCFFKRDFYILFFNYGTLPPTIYPNDRSNMDQWNIDLVCLDKNRTVIDDSYPMTCLSATAPSFLNRYQSMPYWQFKDNPIAAINNEYRLFVSNLDKDAHQLAHQCVVSDNNTSWNYVSEETMGFLQPYNTYGIDSIHVSMDDFIYPYTNSNDTTSFTIIHYINVTDESVGTVAGDSLVRHQGFYNYYSYDDGTPERGYGLTPSDTYMATQFKVSALDSIKGVQILFNRTFNNSNYNLFDICVWKDNNGKPGEMVYSLENQLPKWDDELIYKFAFYKFDETVKVNSTFYVGIRQQSSKSINIGFDTSNDNSQYNFYNTGDGWKNSSFPGSIMIRPVMGMAYFVGVGENASDAISVSPNPAKDFLVINGIDNELCEDVRLFDLTGKVVLACSNTNRLNVSELPDGIYVLRVICADGSCLSSKIIVSK